MCIYRQFEYVLDKPVAICIVVHFSDISALLLKRVINYYSGKFAKQYRCYITDMFVNTQSAKLINSMFRLFLNTHI